jgi:hypothetical protein
MLAATTHASGIPWAAIVPLAIAEFTLLAYCLIDLARHANPRRAPRWAWVLICLFANPLGSIAYLLVGRSEDR